MMQFRYPDNPVKASPITLLQLERSEPGRYIGQFKWDGWRNIVYKDGGKWLRHAKYDTGAQAKIELPAAIVSELDALQFPDGTGFDSEWMGRRNATITAGGGQYIVLLDIHYLNGQWQGDTPYRERLASMKTILELQKAKTRSTPTQNIRMVESTELGLLALFEASKKNPETEGIVVKAGDSKLIGSMTKTTDNGHWLKIKWR